MSEQQHNWQVFRGDRSQDGDRIQQLPPPPPWRQFRAPQKTAAYQQQIAAYWQTLQALAETDETLRDRKRGESFCIRTD